MHFRNTIVAVLGFAAFVACSDRAGVTGPTNGAGVREAPTSVASLATTASIGVSLASPSIAVGKTTQATATVKDSAGNTISKTLTWKSSNTAVATVSSTGLVTGVAAGSASIIASTYYKSGSATVTVTAVTSTPPPTTTTKPGTVTDLSATAASASSVTLSFSQVNDGAGAPAKYDVRVAKAPLSWGAATSVTSGTCSTPLAGTATSGKLTCAVTGLTASTAYNFQLVAYRGTMNQGATYGALSNIAAATTPASGSTTTPITPVATTVSVSPATASLVVGASQTLAATVQDQSGAAMPCSALAWSSANTAIATVTSSGSVKAIAAGSAKITATCASASGFSTITVTSTTTPPPVTPVVTTVSVSPSSASIVAGATQTLAATVRDQNGATMSGQTVTWSSSSASIATVSASGMVTGVVAGSATITATASGKTGSASITVTTAPAPLPPPPSSGSNAHEPSGMTLITERPFSALTENGWYDQNNARYTVVQDPSAPRSASAVGQMKYPAGFAGGASPATAEKGLGSKYTTVYLSYWIKYSSNWVAHESSANKQLCVWSNNTPGTVTEGFGSGSGMIQPGVALQGGENAALRPNLVSNAQLQRGQWHHLEYVISIAGGVLDWWLDGVQVAHYSGRNIGGTTWNTLQWCPVWGGMGGTVPADQYIWMDHLYVSGK